MTCGCSIEPVAAPDFRKNSSKLIQLLVFAISAKTRLARENLTKISDSLPEGHLVTCGCSIETVYGPEFRKVGFKLIRPSVFSPNFHAPGVEFLRISRIPIISI